MGLPKSTFRDNILSFAHHVLTDTSHQQLPDVVGGPQTLRPGHHTTAFS
jgi:hypothetical protein